MMHYHAALSCCIDKGWGGHFGAPQNKNILTEKSIKKKKKKGSV